MKMNLPASVALLFGLFATGAVALDLTPREITITQDGPPQQRYFFQDGERQLSFKIDNKMMLNGGVSGVTFRFRDLNTAGMKLSKSPLQPTLLFDDKNAEAYRAAARAFLPADAAAVETEEEMPDAITINGWKSQQYIFTYTLFGVSYRSTITFLNFSDTEQIVFEVTAAVSDYEKAYARSYRVLNSLGEFKKVSTAGPT